jgi:hypothetical protein
MSHRRWMGLLFAVVACSEGRIGGDPFTAGSPMAEKATSAAWLPAPGGLRKLTVAQYQNSVSDLLGPGITVPADLEPDTAQNGFFAIAASHATISPAAAEKLEHAAYDLAAQALAPEHRDQLMPCKPSGVSDAACARQFVQKLGRGAFRRPLTAAELATYVKLATDAATTLKDFHAGLEFALAGLLQSPNFLFRVELGEPDAAGGGRLRYTGYELALVRALEHHAGCRAADCR